MPEEVVAAEGVAVRGREGLDGLARAERACAAAGLGALPLARVLGDGVVEERVVDVRYPRRVGVVRLVGRAEVEGRALAGRDCREVGLDVERARGLVAREVDEERDRR
jgi:hypothetical protein